MTNYEKIEHLLREIGGRHEAGNILCPLHSAQAPLSVSDSPVLPGGLHLACPYPKCRFSGSVVNLVEKTKGITGAEAMAMFLPGGPLHGLFFTFSASGLPESDFLKYELSRSESQKRISAYLAECHRMFMDDPAARNFVFLKGVKEDHFQQFPCGVPAPFVPDELCSLMPQKDRKDLVVFPYVVSGVVTQLAFHSLSGGGALIVQTDPSVQGMFSPRPIHELDPHTLVICHDEFDAMLFHCKLKEIGLPRIAAVSLLGTSSLDWAPPGTRMLLLSHSGAGLLPETAMAIRRARPSDDIRVLSLGIPLAQLSSMKLRQTLESASDTWRWLVDSLMAMYLSDGLDRLSAELASMGLSAADKTGLLSASQDAGISDKMFLQEIRDARPVCIVRSWGGCKIKRTFSGYRQLEPSARDLSNFILIVNYYTGDDRNTTVCATVKTPSTTCPGYDVALPAESLATASGAKVAELIWNHLVRQDVDFSPFAENLAGSLTWLQLITQFDGARFRPREKLIGVSQGMVRFPRRRISVSGMSDTAADCPPGLSETTADLYRKVGGGLCRKEDVRSLLEDSRTSVLTLGLMAGMLYECTRNAEDPHSYVPRHIVVPCTARGSAGEQAVRQLSWMLSGDEEPMTVPFAAKAMRDFARERKESNGLPIVAQTMEPMHNAGSGWLKYSRSPVALIHPAANLQYLSRIQSIFFVNDGDMPGSREVAQDALQLLRSMAGGLVLMLAGEMRKGAELPAHPACAGLALLASACGISAPDMAMFTESYTQTRGKSAEYFLELLGRALTSDAATVAISRDAYCLGRRADTDIGHWDSSRLVRISPVRAVDTVNAMLPVFARKELTDELLVKKIMDKSWSRRVGDWVFSDETWHAYTGHTYNLADAAAGLNFKLVRSA